MTKSKETLWQQQPNPNNNQLPCVSGLSDIVLTDINLVKSITSWFLPIMISLCKYKYYDIE